MLPRWTGRCVRYICQVVIFKDHLSSGRVSVSLRCLTELAHLLRLVIIFRPSYIGSSE